ncbi:hypothetical protein N0V84_012685 [Fusarium piperis]|uniref:Uncharacterized protein n=1 Tax=Fusarium piperis TaxID=1435070 RepID=A0A9W8W2I9_9HYPO|nr:hypothetical protein N0V84_012685 [Fusarium piperis]
MKGNEGVIKLLLEKDGVDVNAKDEWYGQTPLSWAAEKGNERVIKLLLEKDGVDVNAKDERYGQTPLSWAAMKGNEGVIKLLLEKDGVDVNAKDERYGQTPLSWAAEKGNERVIKLLLEKDGIDINVKDNDGRTPLSWAARKGNERVIMLLLKEDGVDPNSRDTSDRTPLSWAAEKGNDTVVMLLLKKDGVDPDSRDTSGRTPLSWAAEKGNERVIMLLLKTDGVDPNSRDTSGRSPLSWAAEKGNNMVVILLLKEDGVDPDSRDDSGRTPLSWAAEKGNEWVIMLLLDKGNIDVNAKDKNGWTPLLWATLPLENDRVDSNSEDTFDWSPLAAWAAEEMHKPVVELPLAESGRRETINLLLKEMGIFSGEGPALLQTARTDRHTSVIKVLLTDYFDSVAQGPYGWLADIREGSLEQAEMMDLVIQAPDGSLAWIPANISDVPQPEAKINTTLHQPCCAHKRRDIQTSENEKNDAASLDRFTEYVSREEMQKHVSLFCGLAGVIPQLPAPSNDFGMISFFNERASIKVIYCDDWGTPEPRNEDTEDTMESLTVSLPTEKTKKAAMATQHTPSPARLISQLRGALRGLTNAAITLQQTGFCCDQFTVLTAGESDPLPDSISIVRMNTIKFDVLDKLAREIDQLQIEVGLALQRSNTNYTCAHSQCSFFAWALSFTLKPMPGSSIQAT